MTCLMLYPLVATLEVHVLELPGECHCLDKDTHLSARLVFDHSLVDHSLERHAHALLRSDLEVGVQHQSH